MKSILILSGGLDSTVSAYIAKQRTNPILALTFDYGQRAASREIEAARKTADRLKVAHRVLNLPWLKELTHTALVERQKELPLLSPDALTDQRETSASAALVWVPNRNGLFLNIAACFADSLDADLLVTGFNAEEAATFPDNSFAFVQNAERFFEDSTQKKVKVISYTQDWDKIRIAQEAQALGIDHNDLWFCYEGDSKPCGRCESCLRAFRALEKVKIHDSN